MADRSPNPATASDRTADTVADTVADIPGDHSETAARTAVNPSQPGDLDTERNAEKGREKGPKRGGHRGRQEGPQEGQEKNSADGNETPSPLSEIGAALRRLRMQRGLRQYEAAEAAGVTKAMLSAYETGKRRPSLKTLDSLLGAMNAHLGDLHRALMAERHQNEYLAGGRSVARPRTVSEPGAPIPLESGYGGLSLGAAADIYELLGIQDPIPAEEERALSEMLRGFLKLLRFLHRNSGAPGAETRGLPRSPYDG